MKKPSDQQLQDWCKQAFQRAKSYTNFPTSMIENINRAIARIAYKEGYNQAIADMQNKEQP